MTSPIIPNKLLQPWNRLHSKECISIHDESPGKLTGNQKEATGEQQACSDVMDVQV